MDDGGRQDADSGLALLRRLSATMADAFTADEVARATLATVAQLPGVCRAGLALTTAGGRQLRFVSTDEDLADPSRLGWCLIDAFADVPLVDTVRHGDDLFFGRIVDLGASYAGVAARQRELGTRSLASLALATESERIGGLMVCFDEEQAFGTEQRWLLAALASQVTQALRKGLALATQQSTAEQLQRSLMPRSLPDLDGLDLGAHHRPGGLNAEVGGDWYDVLPLADGSAAVVLGDVMGKGTGAAVVMGEMRAALRAYALLDPRPAVVLARMDRFVASGAGSDQIVTLAYALIPPDRRTLRLSLAGHPPPLVAGAAGTRVVEGGEGPALGLGAGPWSETSLDLEPGEVVLFYSNGLVESRDRDLFDGIAQLVEHVDGIASRRRAPRDLCARLSQLMTDERTEDDVTLLAVAAPPRDGVRRASVRLPGERLAPRTARAFVRDTLSSWLVDEDTCDSAELCVSELVTNAVIHTGTPSELTVRLDEQVLTVLVRDGGSTGSVGAAPGLADPLTISGRGLGLVEAVATTWAAEQGADGTTVWFEIERPAV